jgi:FG-GAP-like repeat
MALVRNAIGRAERSNRCRLVRYAELSEQRLSQLFYSFSIDGGNTWSPNLAVSNPFNPFIGYPNQSKIGDYITVVSDDDSANVAYAATFNGEEDIYYVRIRPALPPTDFNGDARPDLLLFNAGTRQTAVWYMNNNVRIGNAFGPTLPAGWTVVALGDFNSDGYPDYLLFNANTGGTVVWYMRNNVRIGAATGPTLPAGRSVAGVADFNGDTHPDFLLLNAATRGTVIWYMSGVTRTGSRNGPTIPAGVEVAGLADFDGNGRPDYLLYNSSTRHTAIWYLNNNLLIRNAAGPTIWAGWSVVTP